MSEVYEPAGLESDLEGQAGFAKPAQGIQGVPYGITWRGPWESDAISFAQVTRRTVRAIERAGMPVFLPANWSRMSAFDADIPDSVFVELGATVSKVPEDGRVERVIKNSPTSRHLDRVLVTVTHCSAEYKPLHSALFPGNAHILMPGEITKVHPFLIAMTALERDRIDGDTVSLLKRFGQVWVPCERNKAVLRSLGVERTHVVPHPLPADRQRELILSKGRMPLQGQYVFYTIGKWEPRKNQVAMIRGFLRAFAPIDRAVLLIKTSPFGKYKGYPETPAEALKALLEEPEVKAKGWTAETVNQKVRVNLDKMSDREILNLHAMGSCYVNTAHGEAWELSCYDALVAGNNLIHTGWGGSEDYAPELPPGHRLWDGKSTEPCHPDYLWGPSRWAKVDQDAITLAFRAAFYGTPGFVRKPPVMHTPESVGAICRKLILDCCNLTEEKVHEWLRAERHRRGQAPDGRALVARGRLRVGAALGPQPSPGASGRGDAAGRRGSEPNLGDPGPRLVTNLPRRGLRDQERPGPARVPGHGVHLRKAEAHLLGPEHHGRRHAQGRPRSQSGAMVELGFDQVPGCGGRGQREPFVRVHRVPGRDPAVAGCFGGPGHLHRKHRALVRRGLGPRRAPPRDQAGGLAHPHHAEPGQPAHPDGAQAGHPDALLRRRPHPRVRLRRAGRHPRRRRIHQDRRDRRLLRALLGPGGRPGQPDAPAHRPRRGGGPVDERHRPPLPRVRVLPDQAVHEEAMKLSMSVPAICGVAFSMAFKDEFGRSLELLKGYEESSFWSGGERWARYDFENPGDVGSSMIAFANGFIRGRESFA